MKLLLTSAGFTNNTIINALQDLVKKPFDQLKLVFIPTAAVNEDEKYFANKTKEKLSEIGFKNIITREIFQLEDLKAFDLICVSGGNTFYLMDQINKYNFGRKLQEAAINFCYVGISAGSIVMTPKVSIASVEPADSNISNLKDMSGLSVVNFEISPHTPDIVSYDSVDKYACFSKKPLYALDDQSAIKIDGDKLEVVSEGNWKKFN